MRDVWLADPQHGAVWEGAAHSRDGSRTSCSPERWFSQFSPCRAGLSSRISPQAQAWLLKALGAGWGRIPLHRVSTGVYKGKGEGLWYLTQSKNRGEKEVFDLKKAVQTLPPAPHMLKAELHSLFSLKSSSSPAWLWALKEPRFCHSFPSLSPVVGFFLSQQD